MSAFSKAKEEDKNAWSAGNIALRRNGFNRIDGQGYSYINKRDKEVNELEDKLRQKAEAELSEEDKEQLELSREYEKARNKRLKQ